MIGKRQGYKNHSNGYILKWIPGHPFCSTQGYVPVHRLVIEENLGRIIDPRIEVVHHLNKNKKDNRLENLVLLSIDDHTRIESGWEKIDEKWFKNCPGCHKYLEVNLENFYQRGNGRTFLPKCKECLKEATINTPTWKKTLYSLHSRQKKRRQNKISDHTIQRRLSHKSYPQLH